MNTYTREQVLKRGLQLLLFLLPWQTVWIYREVVLAGAKWEYGTLAFYATEFLLWGTAIVFLIWFWKQFQSTTQDHFSWKRDRWFIATVAVFVLYCYLSSIWAIDGQLAQQHTLRLMEAFILCIMLFVGPLSAKDATKTFLFGAGIQAVLGLWQFLSQSTFSSMLLGMSVHPVAEPGTSVVAGEAIGRVLRAYGGFSHPNVFGGYMAVSLALLFLLIWKGNSMSRWLQTAFLVLITAALFVTFSRSAWLAGAVIILGFGAWSVVKGKRMVFRCSLICSLTAVICTGLFFPTIANRFTVEETLEVRSVEERLFGIEQATALFADHWMFGVGAGNYTAALMATQEGEPGWAYQPVHNVPLLFVAELGVVGLILLGAVLIALLRYQAKHLTSHAFLTTFLAIGYLLLATFDHYLYSSYIGLAMAGVFWGIGLRFFHTPSTDRPRVMPTSLK